jgi:mono/diheme cytochrome c family protein
MMPYENYRQMPDEDVASVVVFLRSLPPVHNPLPKTEIIFPVKYLIRSVPQPITAPVAAPDISDQVKRGAYLVTMAGCRDCHTPADKGAPLPNMDLAGGQIFEGPWGRVATPNLTPDPSGIPYYDEALFLQALRTGYVRARILNQIMPWRNYGGMTDEDLKAIFAYLKSVKPIHHVVDNAEPPVLCVICNTVHGGGEKNKKE